MRFTLGEMLYRFRIERGIEASQICRGLCSTSAMNYFENGERVPDTLLFECLVERMGVSPEEFSLMVTENEYIYHEWKEKVYVAIKTEKWELLQELLQSDINKKVYCNDKLEKQFFSYARGIYHASQGQYVEATHYLENAEKQTLEERSSLQKRNILLSTMELNILMLELYYGSRASVLDGNEGVKIFHRLESYIYSDTLDVNEQAKCYPKLICIGLNCFKEWLTEAEQLCYCERAIKILRKAKVFYDVIELFRLYIPLLEKRKSDELGFYKKQYEMFFDLFKTENESVEFHPEVRFVRRPKIFMINEYLYSKRKENEFTQEKISEGICEPETYSRVENGKRAPSRKNFKRLAERLDINWCNYCGELDTYELKAYKLRRAQRMARIEGRDKDSLEILEEMEKYLDMSRLVNYQYIKSSELVAKYRLGHFTIDETFIMLENLLKMSQRMNYENQELKYYTQTELEIIGYMTQLLREQKKYQEGIEIIEHVVSQMKNSKVDLEYQWNGFGFLLRNLCGLYFEVGKYETTIKLASYIKHVMIKNCEGANLDLTMDEIADAMEHIGKQYSNEYKKLYRYVYYLADFFTNTKVLELSKKYYENNFDPMMIWYEV